MLLEKDAGLTWRRDANLKYLSRVNAVVCCLQLYPPSTKGAINVRAMRLPTMGLL